MMKILVAVQDHLFESEMIDFMQKFFVQPENMYVVILHVIPPASVGYNTDLDAYADYQAQRERMLRNILQSFRAKVPKVQFSSRIASGNAPDEILKAAGELQVDMLLLGTHRYNAIGKFFLGSVSSDVIAKAECPVLIVSKTKQKEKDVELSEKPTSSPT